MKKDKETKKKRRRNLEQDLSIPDREKLDYLAKTLTRQIDAEVFRKKYAPIAQVLKLAGAGAFLAASVAVPTLPQALKPFLSNSSEYEIWKRFNIPYLKRNLSRLEKQKLIEISQDDQGRQAVEITDSGRKRILRCALDELAIKKPKRWNGLWYLVSYDLPEKEVSARNIFREYLRCWGFFPLQESVFLHAYPCKKEVEFLREYLKIGEYVRIFTVVNIENNQVFKDFFDI